MAGLKRKGEATWEGTLQKGNGTTGVASGAFKDKAFSFSTRFKNEAGTNPEELIAAAHASCFSMALSQVLASAGGEPRRIHTEATLTMEQVDSGFRIAGIHLQTEVDAEGLDDEAIQKAAEDAKENCPVSQLLKPGLDSLTFEARRV